MIHRIVNQELIVNTNCLTPVLLDYIKKACGYEGILGNKEYLDLASETGEIMDLGSKGREYAKKFLDARASYILIKVVVGTAVSLISADFL